jgi:2-polyprenyl-3-methyl-5-hydroxy-6-metoxy-1,4-benzoquinol methylase
MDVAIPTHTVSCPVCGTSCTDPPLYTYSVFEAAACFCPESRNPERYQRLVSCINKLWQNQNCIILQCSNCGFGFGHPFVAGDEEFYSILHEQKGYPAWRWDYDIAIQEALSHFKGGKVLDIGAGEGMFLRGLDSEWGKYAVEGSETTRMELEKAGINVFRDLPNIANTQTGTFDVVTIFQVLEHIGEFQSLLRQCHKLLKTGGMLVVTVPDGEAMIRQEQITGCPDMPPNHLGKWTPTSLRLALTDADFNTGSAIYEPSSLRNYLGSLHLKIISSATRPNSLAAKAYSISNKNLRVLMLSSLAFLASLELLPHIRDLRKGGAFAMVSIAR